MSISIAPLQGNYSEALPIPVRQNGIFLDVMLYMTQNRQPIRS